MTTPTTGHNREVRSITYGPETFVIVGRYISYSDAERIRDTLQERQPDVGDVQIGALGVGPKVVPPPTWAARLVTALKGMAAAAACGAVSAYVTVGWKPTRLLLGVGAAIIVGAIIARRYGEEPREGAAPAVMPAAWVVLRSEPQATSSPAPRLSVASAEDERPFRPRSPNGVNGRHAHA
jgi:hypothetical protein